MGKVGCDIWEKWVEWAKTNTSDTCALETMSTMPMPQLKVRSSSSTPQRDDLASHAKTAGGDHVLASMRQPTEEGSTRGKFSGRPPRGVGEGGGD